MNPRRLGACLAAALLTVALWGCLEPPVREAMNLLFDAAGGLEVVVTTRLQSESDYPKNPQARERLADAREAARCGDDAFTRQLERLAPASLRRSVGYRDGVLRESVRSAAFPDARAVERLFEGAPLAVSLTRVAGETQLEINTGRGGRANFAERLEVAQALDRFSEATARYERALAALWTFLDEHPSRERFVVAGILDLKVEDPAPEEATKLEKTLGETVVEAMDGVWHFLRLEEGRGESLDELSRKAYDPFPAPVTIEVKGTVLESTGFVPEEGGRLRIPSVSLSGALAALSTRWVTPDPLSELARRAERLEDSPPDVDAFLAPGRRVAARPEAAEIRGALEAALAPAPVYRLRWRAPKD
ncbi:MAG: hypothetical protein U0529_15940 [Thermoanaerobaculia bacterium]